MMNTEYFEYLNNSIKVSYKQNKDVGRFFAVGSLSLQSLPRE